MVLFVNSTRLCIHEVASSSSLKDTRNFLTINSRALILVSFGPNWVEQRYWSIKKWFCVKKGGIKCLVMNAWITVEDVTNL